MKNIKKELETIKSCFEEVTRIAWDNCPDADEDSMSEFESDMESTERDFNKAYEAITAMLEKMA